MVIDSFGKGMLVGKFCDLPVFTHDFIWFHVQAKHKEVPIFLE